MHNVSLQFIDWIVTDGQPHSEVEGLIECTCLARGRPFALILEYPYPYLGKIGDPARVRLIALRLINSRSDFS